MRCSRGGFTLLELLTVMVIIGILAVMLVQASGGLLQRADRATCAGNLRGLYVAASAYIQDQGQWPQIPTDNIQNAGYAKSWYAAFKKYGISQKNWICPSIQRALRNPDYEKDPRVDYFPTPFDARPSTPYKWIRQPWFMERANVHGDGQLIIFTNAELMSAQQAMRVTGDIDPSTW